MRANYGGPRSRPASQHGAPVHMRPAAAAPAGRKIFNCIVDDTALVAGVKKSTRNGIRQWLNNGQIRLFVPLHALDQLSKQKGAATRHGEDVRETLKWLDDATSKPGYPIGLQGAEDHFEKWAVVEKFAAPRSLFSENDHDHLDVEVDDEAAPEEDMNNLTLADISRRTPVSSVASAAGTRSLSPSSMRSQRSSVSAVSPPTSPLKPPPSPVKLVPTSLTKGDSSAASVPTHLQPLFNYILWRIHQEANPIAALESFIFLCNDPVKVNYAKGFNIRTKRLEQLREAISREDKDFRNRQLVSQRESQSVAPNGMSANVAAPGAAVTKSPPKAPAAMMPQQNIMDPDAFGRGNAAVVPQHVVKTTPVVPPTPKASAPAGRGGHPLPFAPPFAPRGNFRGNFRGAPRARGKFAGPGRGAFMASQGRPNGMPVNPQIDPNSFVRHRANGYGGRGGRKLWTPT